MDERRHEEMNSKSLDHGSGFSQHDHNLCEVCKKIDFYASLSSVCEDCTKSGPLKIATFRGSYISLGSISRLVESKSCPACRLILSSISTYYRQKTPPSASQVSVRGELDLIKSTSRTEFSSQDEDRNRLPRLEIRVCSHQVEGGSKKEDDDFVGALVPVPDVHLDRYRASSERPVSLLALPGIGDAYWTLPRRLETSTNIDLLSKWITECRELHGDKCRERMPLPESHTNLRLIDIENSRIVPADLKTRYVALSYVWGAEAKPLLTKATIQQYSRMHGLLDAVIPKTILDAMDVAQQLGEQFIWVDSLCIMQDDEADKQEQLPIMFLIYNYAEFVIAAAVGDSAESGILEKNSRQRESTRPMEAIRGMNFTTILPPLAVALGESAWNTRGWTYQEALLAKRVLVFTEYQIYWVCHSSYWCEDQTLESHSRSLDRPFEYSLFGPRFMKTCGIDGMMVEAHSNCHSAEYIQKVHKFVSREFTNPDDSLWAFLGILNMLAAEFPKGYIWGIPQQALDGFLLWRAECMTESRGVHVIPEPGKGYRQVKFPSWTWLGKGSSIQFDSCGDDVLSKVIWHDSIPHGTGDVVISCPRDVVKPHDPVLLPNITNPKAGLGPSISSFGFLHFDAPSATLTIRFKESFKRFKCNHRGHCRALAEILLSDGKIIGMVAAPPFLFRDRTQRQVEFIHLSTYRRRAESTCDNDLVPEVDHSGVKWHKPGCKLGPNVNVMLIEWDESRKVARRLAMARIWEHLWALVQVQIRNIVLG